MSELNKAQFTGKTAEEIRQYILIATQALVDLARIAQADADEARRIRKEIIADEVAEIEEKLVGG
jgi:hypothetical protein